MNRRYLPHLFIPFLIMLPLLVALIPGGLPNTADGRVHLIRATEMVLAWQDGILLPRWSLNLGFGYGIPLFIYAPPLPYLLVAGFHTLGLPPEAAYKAMLVSAITLSSYGAYQLGRVLLGVWAGAITAAALLYAPIQLRELFIQGNAAQLLAWSFAPWAAWAIIQLYRTRRWQPALVLALALAGTLLSHNVVALILTGMVAGMGFTLWLATRKGHGLAWTVGGSGLGLALAAWFWVPALLESRYVALDRIVASDFRTRFIDLAELLAWSPRLDSSAINPYFPMALGGAQLVAAGLGLVALAALAVAGHEAERSLWGDRVSGHAACPRRISISLGSAGRYGGTSPTRGGAERPLFWGTASFMTLFALFCGFMATRWSESVWEILPFVDLFEFPARWHGFTTLGLAWLSGVPVAAIALWRRQAGIVLGVALLGLLLGAALVHLYPQKWEAGLRPFTAREVVRYEERSHAVGTTSLGEFNPIWRKEPFYTSPLVDAYLDAQPVDRLAGQLPSGATSQTRQVTAHRQQYEVELPAATTLTLNLFYFPGWTAHIDGTPVAIWPAPETGLFTLDMPAGAHTLDLRFGPTPLRQAMGILSVIAWLGLAVLLVMRWRAPGQRATPVDHPLSPPFASIGGTAATVAVILLLQLGFPTLFRLTSPPDQALPATITRRADFGGQLRLLGLEPLATMAAPGDTLTVIAYWRVLENIDTDYTVFLHLDDLTSGMTLATADQKHPGDVPTSDWETGQYVRNTLRVTVPPDALPIQYVLRVGFYDPATGARLDTAEGNTLELGRVWVTPPTSPPVPDGLQARFGDSIELLGVTQDDAAITLTWRTAQPIASDYSIFVHLLDANGGTLGQLDGTPYANRYPTSAWRPDQVISDTHAFAPAGVDPAQVAQIAIGIYDPVSGTRLPATDAAGKRLVDDALVVE